MQTRHFDRKSTLIDTSLHCSSGTHLLFSDTLFHALAVVSDRHIHGNRLTVRHILVVGHTLHIQSHIVVEVAILLISSILVQLNCQTEKRFLGSRVNCQSCGVAKSFNGQFTLRASESSNSS